MYYDAQLQQLQEQLARKKQLTATEAELVRQRDALSERVRELNEIRLEEQADVDRLEGRSLTAFFYHVIGKMDERLDKERREAYGARVKYDAAVRELEGAEYDLRRCREELKRLVDCERTYQQLLQEKADAIKASGSSAARQILELEAKIAKLRCDSREFQEAIQAGTAARRTADAVLSHLDSAEGWGTWDLFGGGLIADLAKHGELDEAQAMVEQLQSQLRRFKTELADVTVQADIQVNIDGFLRFADYFFDGLFADWAVMDRIGRAREQVSGTINRIDQVLRRLELYHSDGENTCRRTQEELETLIRETVLSKGELS